MSAKLKATDTDPDTLIPLAKGAAMLGLDPSTIRKRKADTDTLTIVAQGRHFFLVLGEVIAHRTKKIEDARRPKLSFEDITGLAQLRSLASSCSNRRARRR